METFYKKKWGRIEKNGGKLKSLTWKHPLD